MTNEPVNQNMGKCGCFKKYQVASILNVSLKVGITQMGILISNTAFAQSLRPG